MPTGIYKRKTLRCRFLEGVGKLDKNGCINWTKSKLKVGYGKIEVNGKTCTAHRTNWILNYGKIKKGLYILHSCDNRECINIKHLKLGTHKQNMKDMVNKNRSLVGELNSQAKLKEEQVINIKNLYKKGFTQTEIANKYNVTQSLISLIIRNKKWKYII